MELKIKLNKQETEKSTVMFCYVSFCFYDSVYVQFPSVVIVTKSGWFPKPRGRHFIPLHKSKYFRATFQKVFIHRGKPVEGRAVK